jgi:uncharacterized membrane protein YjfL (UPF0719 family)
MAKATIIRLKGNVMRIDLLIGLMVEALAILFAAKFARDQVLKLRGYSVNDLVVKQRSLGASISQIGYLIGILLGFLGAISFSAKAPGYFSTVGHVALSGLMAITLLLVADRFSDMVIFRGLAPKNSTDVNASHAVGKAAVSIATGLVLRGAMSDPTAGVVACIAWFVIAQALMVGAVLFYCRLTPYDDLAEIKQDNLAASFPIAGILLALGFVIEAAVATKGDGTMLQTALHVGKFLGLSLVLLYVFRIVASYVLLPKVKLATAIVEQRSVAAGLQEGVSFLLVSLIVTFFLSYCLGGTRAGWLPHTFQPDRRDGSPRPYSYKGRTHTCSSAISKRSFG